MAVSELIGHACPVCRIRWGTTKDFARRRVHDRPHCNQSGPEPVIGIATIWTVWCTSCRGTSEIIFEFQPT